MILILWMSSSPTRNGNGIPDFFQSAERITHRDAMQVERAARLLVPQTEHPGPLGLFNTPA
jgi:hypothetical protein